MKSIIKKAISILMTALLTFSFFQTIAFAVEEDYGGIDITLYTDDELDLSRYTFEDIHEMSANEYLALVREFERVYDPYGSYSKDEIVIESSVVSAGDNEVLPQWTSGNIKNEEYTEEGSHEYITSVACIILSTDKGFFANNATANIVISLMITLSSLLPDKDENDSAYAGHFYDPDTKENYRGKTDYTAKTNAERHFNVALLAAQNGAMDEAYEHLGRCLHYVQDANEPHHAANKTVLNSNHAIFESDAFDNQETLLKDYNSISAENYRTAYVSNIGTITHMGAVEAKPMYEHIKSLINRSEWEEYEGKSLKNAARYSAMALYKFSLDSGLTLYSV